VLFVFFFQAEDGIRDFHVTGVQTCALPIYLGDGDLVERLLRQQLLHRDQDPLHRGPAARLARLDDPELVHRSRIVDGNGSTVTIFPWIGTYRHPPCSCWAAVPSAWPRPWSWRVSASPPSCWSSAREPPGIPRPVT